MISMWRFMHMMNDSGDSVHYNSLWEAPILHTNQEICYQQTERKGHFGVKSQLETIVHYELKKYSSI